MKLNTDINLTLAGLGLAVAACSSTGVHRAPVLMKLENNNFHIGMGAGEVQVGNHVQMFREVCKYSPKSKGEANCKREELGHGEITQVLSSQYSVVTVPDASKIKEGDLVELHGHAK